MANQRRGEGHGPCVGLARVYIWLAASFVFVDDIAVKEKVEG